MSEDAYDDYGSEDQDIRDFVVIDDRNQEQRTRDRPYSPNDDIADAQEGDLMT